MSGTAENFPTPDYSNPSSYSIDCDGQCEASDKLGREATLEGVIAEIKQRGLHVPLSLTHELAEVKDWLKKNGECSC